jgi:ureidoacrylate peracid hydrolase
MHQASLSEEFRTQLRARRGGRDHVVDNVALDRTAFLVIDMQNAFVAPGAVLEVPIAREIVPTINDLAGELRVAGATIVWIRCGFAPNGRSSWAVFFEQFLGADAERVRSSMYPGNDGYDFWPDLEIDPSDLIVDKDRFSAFIDGASDLEALLKGRGIDTLVISGTVTNVCCESTARDAMMRDFRCIIIEDANAARSDEEHVAGLMTVARVFGDVMTSSEFLAAHCRNQETQAGR